MYRTTVLTLYDLSGDLYGDNEFRDAEARSAYYCQTVRRSPLQTKIIRMSDWPLLPPSDREPWTAWLYFTSVNTMEGYLKIGSNEPSAMGNSLQKSSETSKSRYFAGVNGKMFKWRPASRSLQCCDMQDNVLAVYEYAVGEAYFARLDIRRGAENMLTEIIATLLLNRHEIKRSP